MNNALDFTPDTALFKKDWLPLEQAIQKVARFEHEFGEAHLALACHAALASILTPELVNLIRINFLEPSVEWIAECDLLLSSLCQPINQGIYEIEPQIRQVLLVALQTHLEYGSGRLEEIAHFLYRYSETDIVNELPLHIKRTYQWISGAYIDPDATIQDMFDLLKNVRAEDFMARISDYLHIGKTLAMIANPLEMSGLQVELDDLVGTAQLSTLYWTGDKENLLSLLPENTNDLDEITHALTKPVVNWLATSEFVTSDERALAPSPIPQSTPVIESTVSTERKPVTIFCSYAYEDEELQRELAEYLAPLQAQGLITYWHDPQASLGDIESRKRVFDEYLDIAKVILLLISPNVMASDYYDEIVMKSAMERHEQGDVHIIPIILRPTANWQDEPIGSLQALPINAIPITTWEDRSLAFAEVVSGIERVVEELQTSEDDLHEIARPKEISIGTEPLEVFLVYAYQDTSFLITLENSLSSLREQGLITTWSDRQITPGVDRRQAIDTHLVHASLILLLVSPHFLMSDECIYDVKSALRRYQVGNALVIPIIVRPCMWKEAPFANIQPLPTAGEPITIWKDQSAAFANVVSGIESVVEQLHTLQSLRGRSRELPAIQSPLEIFFVYAYDDEHFFDEIYNYIYPLRQRGLITTWPDSPNFSVGYISDQEMRLQRASLILLLVSPHFLISDDCNHKTQKALQLYQTNGARIIPIIVRPCNWENEAFAHLQALPTYSRPVTRWSHQDAAIADVADGIQRVIEDIKEPQILPEISNRMEAITLPIEVFLAYAHEDEAFLIELEKFSASLKRSGLITMWSDRQILPGAEWKQVIDMRLKRARIILLLVSPHFLNSNYSGLEMQRALQRHQENEARVIPILVQPCEWMSTPFAHLPLLPADANPITNWNDPDEAFVDVVRGIRRIVEEFKALPELQQQSRNPPPSINDLRRPATVFLSYVHEDTEIARDLQLRLNMRGVRCWRDVDNWPIGSLLENEIVDAIEHVVDAIVFFLTPNCLESSFIWQVEVLAALRRHERDPHFHIIPILQDISFAEIRQFCYDRNMTDLSSFNGIVLAENGLISITWAEQNKGRNDIARRILQSAFTHRLRRINADPSYEPSLCLRTFALTVPTTSLDLSLDWLKLIHEKEQISTLQNWEEILWPALIDVKHTISEKVASHRIHLFVKSILPVAVALGFVFRESTGITLLLEVQKEIWSTETHPSEKEPLLKEWILNSEEDLNTTVEVKEREASEEIFAGEKNNEIDANAMVEAKEGETSGEILEGEEEASKEIMEVEKSAVVEVEVSRSTKQGVAVTLSAMNILPTYHIRLGAPEFSRESVRDAAHAQAIAQQVGRVCQELCNERGVRHLHLFVAIPVELAVLIGHQLDALCPITLYEFMNEKRVYEPFCTLL